MINFPSVELAFRSVPRDLFLPGVPLEQVYNDHCIVTKKGPDGADLSSASQPTLVASVLEQLDLRPGHRVLEIGAGTGYNAGLMGHIVGPEGSVCSVDIEEDVAERARRHLKSADVKNVTVFSSDGALGCPWGAPFDRVVLTVAAKDISPAWRDQLKPGGRIVVPLSMRGPQKSIAFEKRSDCLEAVDVRNCHYIMLRGDFDGESATGNKARSSLDLKCELPEAADFHEEELLAQEAKEFRTSVRVSIGEVATSLNLWIALQFPGFFTMSGNSEKVRDALSGVRGGFLPEVVPGVYRNRTICVLRSYSSHGAASMHAPFELCIRSLGPDHALARELLAAIRNWAEAGRPGDLTLSVRAISAGSEASIRPGFVLERRHNTFLFQWGASGRPETEPQYFPRP